jgi:hypothetical protein
MSTCVTNKKMYPSAEIAEEALIEARTQYDFGQREGPRAIYRCEDCGAYHLTSKGEVNEKLKQYLATGKISLHKEANHWMSKIKKR